MFRVIATGALFLTACSVTPPSSPEEAAPGVPFVLTAQRTRLAVAPVLAENVLDAVALWREATAGAYDPAVVVSDECGGADRCILEVPEITDCPLQPEGKKLFGCTYPRTDGRIVVAADVEQDIRVSVMAHEFGHTLFLPHTADPADDLMNPYRSHDTRVHPCISTEDVALAGFQGPGACLSDIEK